MVESGIGNSSRHRCRLYNDAYLKYGKEIVYYILTTFACLTASYR